MNLTLSADDEIIRRAREAARRQGRSLNDLVREMLERLAGKPAGDADAEEFQRICEQASGRYGQRFRRDDAYDGPRS